MGRQSVRPLESITDSMVKSIRQIEANSSITDELKQTPGDSGGQRNLEGYSPQGHKELDMTQELNNNNNLNVTDKETEA